MRNTTSASAYIWYGFSSVCITCNAIVKNIMGRLFVSLLSTLLLLHSYVYVCGWICSPIAMCLFACILCAENERQAKRKTAAHKSGEKLTYAYCFPTFPNPKTEVVKYEFQYYHIINYLSALFRMCAFWVPNADAIAIRYYHCHHIVAGLVSFISSRTLAPCLLNFVGIFRPRCFYPAFPATINYIYYYFRTERMVPQWKMHFPFKSSNRLWACMCVRVCTLSFHPLGHLSQRRQLRIQLNSIKASFMCVFWGCLFVCVCAMRQSQQDSDKRVDEKKTTTKPFILRIPSTRTRMERARNVLEIRICQMSKTN